MNETTIADTLLDLFKSDINKFIKLHNKLRLSFIKEGREENIRKDWETMCNKLKYSDTNLEFLLQIQENLKKEGYE